MSATVHHEFIPYGRQTIEDDDIQAVVDVLRSPFLTTGPKVKEFESAFKTYVQAAEATAVSSGTAGLHAAMATLGIGEGDEVLVPTMSFLASANAILYVGAKPVFVDSLPGEFNLDPEDAERKITLRTKAIVAVHFAGQPVNLEVLRALAKRHRLLIIEDAAHALGATVQGQPVGSLSDMTVFSFHPVKHITTAEGGMVTTGNAQYARHLRQFRHHGIDVDVTQRDAKHSWQYDMGSLGYNYRLTDMQCALGLSQLKKSERFLARREAIVQRYDQAFQNHPKFNLPPKATAGDRHAWHLYILRLNFEDGGKKRNKLFSDLRARGVGAHVHYQPIHLHSFYRNQGWKAGDCPVVERTFTQMLTLPLFPAMTDVMVDQVIDTVLDVLKAY